MRPPFILAISFGAAIIGCHSGDSTSSREVRMPTRLAIYAGNDQSAVAGAAIPIAPAVQVTDSTGLPVQFVAVHFRAAVYSGRLTDSVQATDANGIAAVGSRTLGDALGTHPSSGWKQYADAHTYRPRPGE